MALLLLVVHRSACELFSLRIGSAYGDSAALAVSGDDYATSENNFASFSFVNVKVWSLTILYDRASELGSPVTG